MNATEDLRKAHWKPGPYITTLVRSIHCRYILWARFHRSKAHRAHALAIPTRPGRDGNGREELEENFGKTTVVHRLHSDLHCGQLQEFNKVLGLGTVVPRGDVCFHSDREMQVVEDEANHSCRGLTDVCKSRFHPRITCTSVVRFFFQLEPLDNDVGWWYLYLDRPYVEIPSGIITSCTMLSKPGQQAQIPAYAIVDSSHGYH